MIRENSNRFAIPALLLGAVGIAFAPIFVRLSELGPSATAFHRILIALPLLWLWMQVDTIVLKKRDRIPYGRTVKSSDYLLFLYPGLFFAADLAVWHWSIHFTTVANATLFANFAPIFVTIGAFILFKEKIGMLFITGLLFALFGAATLIGVSFGMGKQQVIGDGLGLLTALFYAGYILSIKRLRREFSTPVIMTVSGVITCLALLPISIISGESLWVTTFYGWMVLIGLAWISHAGGQALIAYALAHLSASFASVVLLLQPAGAALLAWIILGEVLGWKEAIGAIFVLIGIFLAWRSTIVMSRSIA